MWIQEYRGNTGIQDKCGYKNTEGALAHKTSVDTRIQKEHWYTGQVWIKEYRRNTGTQDKCGYRNTEGTWDGGGYRDNKDRITFGYSWNTGLHEKRASLLHSDGTLNIFFASLNRW